MKLPVTICILNEYRLLRNVVSRETGLREKQATVLSRNTKMWGTTAAENEKT
jgi:hypothetical protein